MSLRRIITSIVIVAALAAGGYWAYLQFLAPQEESPADPAGAVNAITIDTGVDVVSAEGTIVPLREVTLAFEIGGRTAEVLVEAGDSVLAGQPLVRLESTDLEIALSQAQAGVTVAEANVDLAEAALLASQEGVSAAEAGVAIAESGVVAAQAQLALLLSEPTAAELASSESNVAVAAAALSQAEANRDAALEIPTSLVRSAEAQVAAALAEERVLQDQYDTLVDVGIGGTPEEQARFALNAAEAAVAAAQATLDEVNDGATPAERRALDAAVAVASAQRNVAQAQLDLILSDVKAEQADVAEAAVSQAEAGLQQARAAVAQAERAVAQAEAAVGQAEAGVVQAEAAVKAAEAALEKTILRAPFDGLIASAEVEVGEVVAPGLPVVTFADVSVWQVKTTDLTELDIVAIAVGMPAAVTVDAISDQQLDGTVTDIDTVAGLTRGDVTYGVAIRLEDSAGLPLRWGMTVFVEIDVDS